MSLGPLGEVIHVKNLAFGTTVSLPKQHDLRVVVPLPNSPLVANSLNASQASVAAHSLSPIVINVDSKRIANSLIGFTVISVIKGIPGGVLRNGRADFLQDSPNLVVNWKFVNGPDKRFC